MKLFLRIFLFLIILLGVLAYWQYPKLTIVSGYAAKNMVSTIFIANRAAESVAKEDNNVALIRSADVENGPDFAMATVFGLMERKAICHEGLGCVLVGQGYDGTFDVPVPRRTQPMLNKPFPYGNGPARDTVFSNVDYEALDQAIDNAFAEPGIQRTRTVLVLHKAHIVAERYATGFTSETPILGWSMTKSILATLFGILESEGRIDLEDTVPVTEWSDDERSHITWNHLLRMQSGLAWDEDYTTISDVTRMLFLAKDMSRIQREKEAIAPPTEIWNYSSGTTNLLSGLLRQQLGNHQSYMDFPYQALIDRIGMYSMVLETDLAGNYVGSSYAWASTRDWAKFGLLYLNNGNWNGHQLFDTRWVDYVTRPTVHSNGTYGAHFWLNAEGKYPGVPRDLYSANGFQGQRVFIVPSKDLVIVRTGLAEAPDFDMGQFLREVIEAVH